MVAKWYSSSNETLNAKSATTTITSVSERTMPPHSCFVFSPPLSLWPSGGLMSLIEITAGGGGGGEMGERGKVFFDNAELSQSTQNSAFFGAQNTTNWHHFCVGTSRITMYVECPRASELNFAYCPHQSAYFCTSIHLRWRCGRGGKRRRRLQKIN